MKIVYFQAKEDIAGKKFSSLKELCIDLGVSCLKDLDVDKHTNYESWDSVTDFERVIVSTINNRLKSDILSASWYSVVLDESTNVSNEQSLIVYVKLVVNGELKTHFLELVALNGCKAHDIFTAACDVLIKFGIVFSKVSAISTDGASVMVGERRGVATLFKEKNGAITSVHCVAQRLALASSQAVTGVSYLETFEGIVNRIYRYFSQSPNRTRHLKAMQQVMGQAEHKFVSISATRWLSFAGAVNAVIMNWECLNCKCAEGRQL